MVLGAQSLAFGSPRRRGLEPLPDKTSHAVGRAAVLIKLLAAEFLACGHAAFGILQGYGQPGNAPRHKLVLDRRRIDQLQQLVHDVAETPGLLASAISARRIERKRPVRDLASTGRTPSSIRIDLRSRLTLLRNTFDKEGHFRRLRFPGCFPGIYATIEWLYIVENAWSYGNADQIGYLVSDDFGGQRRVLGDRYRGSWNRRPEKIVVEV